MRGDGSKIGGARADERFDLLCELVLDLDVLPRHLGDGDEKQLAEQQRFTTPIQSQFAGASCLDVIGLCPER